MARGDLGFVSRCGLLLGLTIALGSSACTRPRASHTESGPAPTPTSAPPPARDEALEACRARVDAVMAEPALPGDPAFDEKRVAILGRARGEPVVMVRAPKTTSAEELTPTERAAKERFDRATVGVRMGVLKAALKGQPRSLRKLVLREGYAYATEPYEAYGIASSITLPDLFDEPSIWLQRGGETRPLERRVDKRETSYRYVDGPLAGRAADLLFGDRVAVDEAELATPLHRDLKRLADVEGFDRARLVRTTERAIVAELAYGAKKATALLEAKGAELTLACVAEASATRDAITAYRETTGPKRRALLAMHDTITEQVQEAFRFDRPEGVTGPDQDGELRPVWFSAYLRGQSTFEYQGSHYAVFDGEGRAWPPEVCVDFVLDTFERTSGTWFGGRGETLGRVRGRLDFDDEKIANRRGVMGFGKFAEQKPELFDFERVPDHERVQFKERDRFFAQFGARDGDVRAGDIVAIHGMKADHRIHQHAILVEWTDPLTGFPYGLADQMKRPRRRTWEGIMAEAPLRSLYYRVRPKDLIFAKLDPEAR